MVVMTVQLVSLGDKEALGLDISYTLEIDVSLIQTMRDRKFVGWAVIVGRIARTILTYIQKHTLVSHAQFYIHEFMILVVPNSFLHVFSSTHKQALHGAGLQCTYIN